MPEIEPTPIDRGRHEPVTTACPSGKLRKHVGAAGAFKEVVAGA